MQLFIKASQKTQTGAVLVEFAIVVPLLLLLVIGIIEFSYAYYHLNILNKSVQDAARYFSNPDYSRCLTSTNCSPSYNINVNSATNSTNIINAQNLVIYGNTAVTGNALMPPINGSGYIFLQNSPFIPTANHIQFTVQYNHDFLLGNVLNNFLNLGIPNPYPLTASSTLRVE